MPEYFPQLSRVGFMGGNMSGLESQVQQLSIPNAPLIGVLELYEPGGVRREFERRMAAEKELPLKLLLAALAARAGSREAALFLLATMKDTRYESVRNVHRALYFLLAENLSDPPDWIVELALAAISDERHVTGLEGSGWSRDTHFTISYLADEYGHLTGALGFGKVRKAVPVLTEMAKRTKGARGPIIALGQIGDPQAIPVLIQSLKTAGENVEYSDGFPLPDRFSRPVWALAALRAKEAVPLLLEHVEFPEVIEALENIGDPKAVPALREIVAAKGKLVRNGKAVYPKLEQPRFFAACLALAALEDGDAVPQLCKMLTDRSLDEFQRRTIVWRLRDRGDARAVPHLIGAIKNDPSGAVGNQAITVLGTFKVKTAVEGLIDCFDAEFRGKSDWKRAYTPAMFRENIAESLRRITGQPFGADKEQWRRWWQERGKNAPELK